MQIALAVLLGVVLGAIAGMMEAGLWIDKRRGEAAAPKDHLLPLTIVVGSQGANGVLYKLVTESEDTAILFGVIMLSTFIFAIVVIAVIKLRSNA